MHRRSIASAAFVLVVFGAASAATAHAQSFTLQVGPPAAAAPRAGTTVEKKVSKDSVFVVRPVGCVDPASAQIASTAEGVVDGVRRSVPLRLLPLPTPGVHAVLKAWPAGGMWIVALTGTCGGSTSGAIVAMGTGATYDRAAVTRLSHRPTTADIDGALEALADGVPAASER